MERVQSPGVERVGWTGKTLSPGTLQINRLCAMPNAGHLVNLEFTIHNLCGLGELLTTLSLGFLICKMELIRSLLYDFGGLNKKMNVKVPGTFWFFNMCSFCPDKYLILT